MTKLDDNALKRPAPGEAELDPQAQTSADIAPLDFRHSNRLPNSQLSLIRVLHEAFARTLTSSLSLTLRSFVSGNVISVEQSSYGEFSARLQSPTCIVYLSMLPYEGYT